MLLTTLRQRNFALLWLGGLISQTGDWLLMIGLPVYVYTQTGSALATSLTLITGFIPGLLFGSLAGVLVEQAFPFLRIQLLREELVANFT